MATLPDTIDIQPTTPNYNFEPEAEWKASLIQLIEDTICPTAEKLKRELAEKLIGLCPHEISKARTHYDKAMGELCLTADGHYRWFLEREHQVRRWRAGEKVNEEWSEAFKKERQELLDKKGATARDNQPEPATRDEGRSRFPSSAKMLDRATLPPESDRDRT